MIRQQYNPDEFDPDDFAQSKQRELDASLLVKFYYKPVQDKKKTLEAERPIFEDRLYIDIRIPGERDGGFAGPATEAHKRRFPRHYEAFMKRTDDSEQEVGTPLAEWPLVTRSQVEELAFFNVKTVEQLAGMPDSGNHNFRSIVALKAKAKEWLQANQGKEELEAKLEQRDAQIEELMKRVQQLEAKPAKKVTAKAKPRGRPRKKATAKKESVNVGTADIDGE